MNAAEQTLEGSSILLVDDEQNILSSLKRTLRPLKCNVLTALGGEEGLKILRETPIDLIVSDMRMPGMTGAEFLEQAANLWPNTRRILLTGYSDNESTIAVINKGKIHSYIDKPWKDDNLKLTLTQFIREKQLQERAKYLEDLTLEQNKELEALNSSLESKVDERTEQLQLAFNSLEKAIDLLEQDFNASVSVLSNLIELKIGKRANNCRDIAELAKVFSIKLGYNEGEVKDIYYAALLHNLGMLGLSDELIDKPYSDLTAAEKQRYHQHPRLGSNSLIALDKLANAADIIAQQFEYIDGTGYPNQLRDDAILPAAQVLLIVRDFYDFYSGVIDGTHHTFTKSLTYLQSLSERYNERLLAVFENIVKETLLIEENISESCIEIWQAQTGMSLAQDVRSHEGLLLLTKGTKLSDKQLDKLHAIDKACGKKMKIYVFDL